MSKCYAWIGTGSNGYDYSFNACAANPGWIPQPDYPGYFIPADNGTAIVSGWWTTSGGIIACNTERDLQAANGSRIVGGTCGGCLSEEVSFDCINGACILSSTYKTPGIYKSLTECENNCGGSNCNGVCIKNSDWAQIQGLANQLRNKNCS